MFLNFNLLTSCGNEPYQISGFSEEIKDPEFYLKPLQFQDFPGGPVVKTSPSNAGGASSIPGRGAKIPHATQPKHQNIKKKQKQYCNKFNKDFKNGPHQKKKS